VKTHSYEKLMHKIINGGRTNPNEWFERIVRDYIEEQAIEYRESVETIKNKFYIELHDGFMCTIMSLLHKFLLDKGVRDIIKYRTPLGQSSSAFKLEREARRVGIIP
jgi:hypothetical protein